MRSNEASLREFCSSIVWEDLKDIIEERVASCREELEVDNGRPTDEEIRIISITRGRLSELRFLLALPKWLEENVEKLKGIDEQMRQEDEDNG